MATKNIGAGAVNADCLAGQIMLLFEGEGAVGQTVLTTPGVPEDRLAALRTAFDETMTDPDFIAETKKAKLDVHPAPGAKVQDIVAKMTATPPDLRRNRRRK